MLYLTPAKKVYSRFTVIILRLPCLHHWDMSGLRCKKSVPMIINNDASDEKTSISPSIKIKCDPETCYVVLDWFCLWERTNVCALFFLSRKKYNMLYKNPWGNCNQFKIFLQLQMYRKCVKKIIWTVKRC
jgi:hypothetical protein